MKSQVPLLTGAATSMEDLSGDPTVTLGLRLMGAVGQVQGIGLRDIILGNCTDSLELCDVVNFIAER